MKRPCGAEKRGAVMRRCKISIIMNPLVRITIDRNAQKAKMACKCVDAACRCTSMRSSSQHVAYAQRRRYSQFWQLTTHASNVSYWTLLLRSATPGHRRSKRNWPLSKLYNVCFACERTHVSESTRGLRHTRGYLRHPARHMVSPTVPYGLLVPVE